MTDETERKSEVFQMEHLFLDEHFASRFLNEQRQLEDIHIQYVGKIPENDLRRKSLFSYEAILAALDNMQAPLQLQMPVVQHLADISAYRIVGTKEEEANSAIKPTGETPGPGRKNSTAHSIGGTTPAGTPDSEVEEAESLVALANDDPRLGDLVKKMPEVPAKDRHKFEFYQNSKTYRLKHTKPDSKGRKYKIPVFRAKVPAPGLDEHHFPTGFARHLQSKFVVGMCLAKPLGMCCVGGDECAGVHTVNPDANSAMAKRLRLALGPDKVEEIAKACQKIQRSKMKSEESVEELCRKADEQDVRNYAPMTTEDYAKQDIAMSRFTIPIPYKEFKSAEPGLAGELDRLQLPEVKACGIGLGF